MKDAAAVLERIEKGIKGVDKRVSNFETRLTAVEDVLKSRAGTGADLPGVEDENEKFSFARAIHAIAFQDWSRAGFEKSVFEETRKRALAAGQDTKGGFLVPNQLMGEMIELLRANVVVQAMGATNLNNLQGSPVEISKQTGGIVGSWVGENEEISEEEQTFGMVKLTPKQASAMVKVSNRSLNLSNPALEQIVRNDIAEQLARLIDLAALRGIGSENQPLGIVNTPGINSVVIDATNGGEISYDFLVDMETEVDEDNALRGRLGYVFHPRIKAKIQKLKDADNRPLFQWDPSIAQPSRTLIGYPWMTTTQLPKNLSKGSNNDLSEIIFADWSQLLWGTWGGLMLDASREAGDSFAKNQTWVRGIMEVDVALRHEESFCLINDAKTGA